MSDLENALNHISKWFKELEAEYANSHTSDAVATIANHMREYVRVMRQPWAWRCVCGTLNEGRFGSGGVNDGKEYSYCRGCSCESFRADNQYRLVELEARDD